MGKMITLKYLMNEDYKISIKKMNEKVSVLMMFSWVGDEN